jgi:hypothetical protein
MGIVRLLFASALAVALLTTVVPAQGTAPMQIYASVVDAGGTAVRSLDVSDVRVLEDGAEATVTKVERLDWPVKLQLLLDNGVGLGGGSIQSLKIGAQGLLDALALPEYLQVTIVTTAPQPRLLVRAAAGHAALERGLELVAPDTRVGRFVESLLEATERVELDASDYFPVIVSVATTSGDRRMKESDVERILARLAARPTTVHVVLYTGGPQGASQAAYVQGSPFAGANQFRVGSAVAKFSGGTYESINNAARLESLLPAIGENVAAAVERYRQQFRITALRPASASGPTGTVNVRVQPPLATVGLSFDGPVR